MQNQITALPPGSALTRMAVGLVLAVAAGASSAQASVDAKSASLHLRAQAANCAACHGTDGRSAEGNAVPSLAGQPKATIVAQMKSFKDGTRQATVMHQLSKGYTDAQIDELATYFASLKR